MSPKLTTKKLQGDQLRVMPDRLGGVENVLSQLWERAADKQKVKALIAQVEVVNLRADRFANTALSHGPGLSGVRVSNYEKPLLETKSIADLDEWDKDYQWQHWLASLAQCDETSEARGQIHVAVCESDLQGTQARVHAQRLRLGKATTLYRLCVER